MGSNQSHGRMVQLSTAPSSSNPIGHRLKGWEDQKTRNRCQAPYPWRITGGTNRDNLGLSAP
ncbi:hypothetical protein GQ55_7G104800 [Panicum hallii var. hallii]|uniref:Uncharacterized protein n=1 Tax=Panicum hallii var. hallii TaxID=1504633 RepID=A0A2T7CTS1_9POAL|nr:hypothetical protein GQ55_7G104800 [Panicum hallii var. hallii]